jgi:predicted RND superfamily exporter protein
MVLSVILAGAFASGARFIQFDDDYRAFFSKENPQLTAFEALERIYTKDDVVLFVIRPGGGDVFTREVLTAVGELTEAGWKLPYSMRVDSLTNFQHTRAEGDDLVVEDLVSDPTQLTDGALERVRSIAHGEPVLHLRMVSADSSTTGVLVRLQVPGKAPTELPEAASAARMLRDRIRQKYPDLEIRLSGSAMLGNAFAEVPKIDLATLIPLMYGIIIVAMVLFFRSLVATVATLLVVILAASTSLGMAGWAGLKLNGVSASAPTIVLTLAVADCVHILMSMLAVMARGIPQREALIESMRINAQPVFLTSLTTAIGFLSLNFGDAPPMRHLGNLTAVGVTAAWIFAMSFLPAILSIVPLRARPRSDGKSMPMERVGEFVIANRRVLLPGMSVLVVGLTAAIPFFEINDRPVEYFGKRIELRQDADYAMQHLVGVYSMSYSLAAGEAGGINDPAYLERLEAYAEWMRRHRDVQHVSAFTDVMKRLNKNMHGDDPSYYRLPGQRELAAQYLLLYEMSLPYGLDINDQINVDKSATRMDVILQDVDFKILKEIEAESKAWLAEHALASMQSQPASPAVMFAYIAERNIYAMVKGTAIAFTLISLVLIVALRSVKIGLISLVPNIVPAAMAFGIWSLIYGQVGFAVSIVASVSIGIIVDDTVHFLTKYLRARREEGLDSVDAVRYAFRTVGLALFATSAILIVGFALLGTSQFWPNATLGLLTALAIACALVADFLLLPPLLIALDR